ncbi:gliding motility lipoprotein GldB [Rapidithrix thailandica]|uniref:Gliding motility lipoprotein GldB n=1 Tax=Rapidithrix thailandica TaxID=413964 RepID=A0AAW9SDJ2_9BACT
MKNLIYTLPAVLLIGLMALVSGCGSAQEEIPDVSDIQVDIKINRLEKELFAYQSKYDFINFIDQNPELVAQYFKGPFYPTKDSLASHLYHFTRNVYNDTLYRDVQDIFTDFEKVENDLIQAFRYLKYYYPDFKVPRIYTMISGFGSFGFGQDIFFSDSLLVIGLDYFAGTSSTYRPPEVPGYILKRYVPEHIVPSVMKFISSKFNQHDYNDKSMLAEMMFYGKANYFTHKMMPHASDTLIMGYSVEELTDVEENSGFIWGHFVKNNLFYETNDLTKRKYVGERPRVFEVSDKCPGRVGRWLGYQIVKSYAWEHTDAQLSGIMQMKNARALFQASKYKPQVP